jgi:hypothetical protein
LALREACSLGGLSDDGGHRTVRETRTHVPEPVHRTEQRPGGHVPGLEPCSEVRDRTEARPSFWQKHGLTSPLLVCLRASYRHRVARASVREPFEVLHLKGDEFRATTSESQTHHEEGSVSETLEGVL